MVSSLKDMLSVPEDDPVILTLIGEQGRGKTTCGATFPNPVFMRVENGVKTLPFEKRPQCLYEIDSVEDVWDQLKALINDEHDFKTLVIDSVTALDDLFINHVINSDPNKPKGLNQAYGGYGNGGDAVANMHGRVRKACEVLRKKRGMHTVFISHAKVTTIDLPDQEPYSTYTSKLLGKSQVHYIDNVDLVGYIKLKTIVRGDKNQTKKALSNGDLVIDCTMTANNISKNRYGIKELLPLEEGVNPFIGIIPTLTVTTSKGE